MSSTHPLDGLGICPSGKDGRSKGAFSQPRIRSLQGKFTTKSDVWSFGVTLWEILIGCRSRPFEPLSDQRVIADLSRLCQTGQAPTSLPSPPGCPREILDLMRECWHKEQSERPTFTEIHLFLQRKNLGFDPTS
jgi:discoidin domain receptor family protein 2